MRCEMFLRQISVIMLVCSRGMLGGFSPETFGFSSSNIPISIHEFYCLIFLGLLHTFQVVHLSVSVAGQVN